MKKIVSSIFILFSIMVIGVLGLEQVVYGNETIDEAAEESVRGPITGPDGENLWPGGEWNPPPEEPGEIRPPAEIKTHPKTSTGERLTYNTSYYLRDKNLSNRGGVTFQAWLNNDYAIFGSSTTNRGTPIVFEHPNGNSGVINSDDPVTVRSTNSNWNGAVYWSYTDGWNSDSVRLYSERKTFGNIYGSTTDNSVGLSIFGLKLFMGWPIPAYFFGEFHGSTGSTPWMTARWYYLNNPPVLPAVERRMTPFYIEEI